MKKMKKQARQGDVFLRVVDGEPTGKEVPRGGGRIILAHGEATGHAHAIAAFDVALLMDETTLSRHLDTRGAKRSPILDHEEHEAIELPAGKTIEVRQQREYHPAGLRNVLD
jgi:hypothetical protein